MKHLILGFIFLFVTSQIFAQKKKMDQNQLISTEFSFAASAAEIGTRDSFLKFIADDGIIFRPGPVNGKTFLTNAPKRPGLLSWFPVHAEISKEGDMGFTTGPAEFRKDKDSAAIWFGNFCTVWQRQSDGEFKFVIDYGNNNEKPSDQFEPLKYEAAKSKPASTIIKKNELKADQLFELDRTFAKLIAEIGTESAYKKFINKDSRLLRDGEYPFIGTTKIINYLSQKKIDYKFNPVGGKVSSSNDLGFTYGEMEISNGSMTSERYNYMRVWKNDGENWVILAEVANKIEK
ncbi:MAG: hypothetical protein NTX65_15805 [Ignavibacteriales bacterium]|nr:hypothetical protein [Ignavibacteriales bacterium]